MSDDKIIIKVDGVEFESTLPDAIEMLSKILRLRKDADANRYDPQTQPTQPVYVPVPFYVQPYPPAWLWPPYTTSCTSAGTTIKAIP